MISIAALILHFLSIKRVRLLESKQAQVHDIAIKEDIKRQLRERWGKGAREHAKNLVESGARVPVFWPACKEVIYEKCKNAAEAKRKIKEWRIHLGSS